MAVGTLVPDISRYSLRLIHSNTSFCKDRDEIALCRGARNRIGFALLLGGVRLLGRFPYDVESLPKDLLARIRGQLEVDAPLFLNYPQRRATRQERIERIRQYPELRPFIESDRDGVKAFVCELTTICSRGEPIRRQFPFE